MAIELNSEDARLIRGFIPINTLPGFQFDDLCASHQVSTANDGDQLFAEGSVDTDYYFLLEGCVSFEAGKTEVDVVEARTTNARFALAHHIPRKVTCVAQGLVRYLKIDSEIFSGESVSKMLQQNDMVTEESKRVNEEAIPFLLKSPLLRQLSVSVLPNVSICLGEAVFEAGQTIIEQDKTNDVFYILQEGQCKVTHRPYEDAKEIQLEDLKQGDTFGEYALLVDGAADTTVKAVTDCLMYTIDGEAFDQCIKQPLVHELSWSAADQSGDVLLDIQQLDDYRRAHVKGSVNYPFSTLRVRMGQLSDTDNYIVISKDDKISQAAVVMLRQQQINARVLAGGLKTVPDSSLEQILTIETDSEAITNNESEASQLAGRQTSGPHSAAAGDPATTVAASEKHKHQSSKESLPEEESTHLDNQSEFSGEGRIMDSEYKDALTIDGNEISKLNNTSNVSSAHIRKLEEKLQEVWNAYKKTRRQLHRRQRKYAACFREYSRAEQRYHNLLLNPESNDTAINPSISADQMTEQLREELSHQINENNQLKQQNSLLKKKIAETKRTSPATQGEHLSHSTAHLSENEALLLQIQELEETVRHLEQIKISQQNKTKQYVDENNQLRQLIQELAKQAIDEQAQGQALASFDFITEFASSNDAYDADSALAKSETQQNTKADSTMTMTPENNAEQISIEQTGSLDDETSQLQEAAIKKTRVRMWVGITSTILLTALVACLFVYTEAGQQLLQQFGF